MPYILKNPETYVGKAYKNNRGNTECVEFIRQTLGVSNTAVWVEGKKVTKGDHSIAKGTAIATFVKGKYPQEGSTGKHAAIYLDQSEIGIKVLDQWRAQGKVLQRTIKFEPTSSSLSNDGKAFSVIETTASLAETS